jgi:hypothetical protein
MTRAGPLAIANLLITVRAAVAGQPMAPADIQAAFFNGQPFVAAALAGNKFKMTFTPDGKMTREPLGQSGKPISGTWKLNAKGFCTSWERAGSNCFTVVPSGENKWLIQRTATTITTTIAVWSK